jgi:two-component system response regulator HydG
VHTTTSAPPEPVTTERPRRLSGAPPPVAEPVSSIRVLIVDDEPALRRSLARVLAARGLDVSVADDGRMALEQLASARPDVMLVDLMMPNVSGLELLSEVKTSWPSVEVIMMTAFADVDAAVRAVKAGAYDFLTKPFPSNDAVVLSVLKAAEHKRLIERAAKLEERLASRERFGEMIGTSRRMQSVYRLIEGVASATSTVLVLGESGTGKELVARAIHQNSARASNAFVPVNCAAIPKDLVESELFGHVRGAFTGAQNARAGLFEAANGGTIFLDEIGDLPLAAQVKLLRTLQDGEIKRVGSDDVRTVDVRVVAATNVDLKSKIESGEFRRDLFYRLNVIAIQLPPLRQRDDDVAILTHHFLQKLALRMGRPRKGIAPDAMAVLKSYSWPGNVRELEHAIEHAFVLSHGENIGAADLPFARETDDEGGTDASAALFPGWSRDLHDLPYAKAKRRALSLFDEAYVRDVMRRAAGNLSEAARKAGLDRSNFRRIARRFREE